MIPIVGMRSIQTLNPFFRMGQADPKPVQISVLATREGVPIRNMLIVVIPAKADGTWSLATMWEAGVTDAEGRLVIRADTGQFPGGNAIIASTEFQLGPIIYEADPQVVDIRNTPISEVRLEFKRAAFSPSVVDQRIVFGLLAAASLGGYFYFIESPWYVRFPFFLVGILAARGTYKAKRFNIELQEEPEGETLWYQ